MFEPLARRFHAVDLTHGSSRNGWNMPMAFEPPPTQAPRQVGQPAFARPNCARASLPITVWKSRTIIGIGMRPRHRTDDVIRVVDVGHPVAHRFVDRVLQRREPDVDGRTSAPSSRMRKTLGFWRSISTSPM